VTLKLFSSYSFQTGMGQHHHRTARQRDQRALSNHLSLIKDQVPEMGRNFRLVYAGHF
jgi:hypothetical protein